MGEQYLRSQAAYANGGTSPHISPCDSAYDRDKDSLLKHDSHAPSGLERASSAHDEVLTICNGSVSWQHLQNVFLFCRRHDKHQTMCARHHSHFTYHHFSLQTYKRKVIASNWVKVYEQGAAGSPSLSAMA